MTREIKISMEGKVASRENVFVDRMRRRAFKYEEVYLLLFTRVSDARAGLPTVLGRWPGRPTSDGFCSLRSPW